MDIFRPPRPKFGISKKYKRKESEFGNSRLRKVDRDRCDRRKVSRGGRKFSRSGRKTSRGCRKFSHGLVEKLVAAIEKLVAADGKLVTVVQK